MMAIYTPEHIHPVLHNNKEFIILAIQENNEYFVRLDKVHKLDKDIFRQYALSLFPKSIIDHHE